MSVDETNKTTERKEKGGKRRAVIVIGIVAAAAVIGVAVYFALGSGDTQSGRNVVVNEDNVEEILADLQENQAVSTGYYEVTMNTTWNFADGKAISENAYVKNVVTNTNDVYFDVNISETDELIYSSPVIPLGSYLENIALDKELDAGTYDCVCTYHLVDENQNTLSTLKINLTIIVAE